jgi:hypothetical protein
MSCDRADCPITSEYVGGRNAPSSFLSKVGGGVWSCAESMFYLGTMQERHKLVMAQDGRRAQCNIKKWWEIVSPGPRCRLCKRTDGGPPAKMATVRNVIILKWWEIGLAQTQDGGCVNEQMAGPLSKMAAARSVIILKKAGNSVSPDPRWRLCKKRWPPRGM